MAGEFKEVLFNEFCKSCTYEKYPEEAMPCCECLEEPANIDSHKPVRFKEKDTRKLHSLL